MATDLWGNTTPETVQEELHVSRAAAVDQLREEARRAEQDARRFPSDELKRRRAENARANYLALLDFHEGRGISLERVARLRRPYADEPEPLPRDRATGDLFDTDE